MGVAHLIFLGTADEGRLTQMNADEEKDNQIRTIEFEAGLKGDRSFIFL